MFCLLTVLSNTNILSFNEMAKVNFPLFLSKLAYGYLSQQVCVSKFVFGVFFICKYHKYIFLSPLKDKKYFVVSILTSIVEESITLFSLPLYWNSPASDLVSCNYATFTLKCKKQHNCCEKKRQKNYSTCFLKTTLQLCIIFAWKFVSMASGHSKCIQ
jgi:hypothetical protein